MARPIVSQLYSRSAVARAELTAMMTRCVDHARVSADHQAALIALRDAEAQAKHAAHETTR